MAAVSSPNSRWPSWTAPPFQAKITRTLLLGQRPDYRSQIRSQASDYHSLQGTRPQELPVHTEKLGIDSELRLTMLAEAKEYRMSEAKRKHLEASWNQTPPIG